jgi:hypothetical protein
MNTFLFLMLSLLAFALIVIGCFYYWLMAKPNVGVVILLAMMVFTCINVAMRLPV